MQKIHYFLKYLTIEDNCINVSEPDVKKNNLQMRKSVAKNLKFIKSTFTKFSLIISQKNYLLTYVTKFSFYPIAKISYRVQGWNG